MTAVAPLMPSRNSPPPASISLEKLPSGSCSSGETSGETRASAASRLILWEAWQAGLVRAWRLKGKCKGMRNRRVR